MPVVAVNRDALYKAIGRTFTDEEFDYLCFEFGVELDEITTEKQMARKEVGKESASDDVIFKIDIPANRYDLLCLEGLARAIRIFLGVEKPPQYKVKPAPKGKQQVITVKPETAQIRPFVVGAVLRNLKLDHDSYNSFLDLQDKLHQNICRRRTLVAIGTHDLDTIQGPFTYEARNPKNISFVPLNQTKKMTSAELMEFLRTNPEMKHLKPYTDIIYDSPVYPVIYDKNGVVLSLPPIINGDHSKISKDTKNCFIECTATDLNKARIVLNILVTTFSQYCTAPFEVEPVEIKYPDGKSDRSPNLSNLEMEAEVKEICSVIGVEIDIKKICELCSKMQLQATPNADGKTIKVQVPPTRADILHPVDITEDVAIAYGYNNIPKRVAPTLTVGSPDPINLLTDLLRLEVSRAGYIEVLTHGLCSTAENFTYLRQKDDGKSAVVLSNPATLEFEVVRTTLLPGILKTLESNKSIPMKDGVKFFEISDVVVLDSKSDTGAKNIRKLAALYSGPTAGFEIIHGLVDRLMECVDVSASLPGVPKLPYGKGQTYKVVPSAVPTFFPGRSADIILIQRDGKEQNIGFFGVLHPEVLSNFELTYPASALELNIEVFL